MDIKRGHKSIEAISSAPFGDVGAEMAQYAGLLMQSFSAEPEARNESGGMSEGDCWALEYWLGLEHLVPLIEVNIESGENVRQPAHDALAALHTATPFSEAEREWLLHMGRQRTGGHTVETFPGWVETQEAQIMSAGIKRIVTGRDLMRRWTAWRRGQDEFDGQDGLNQAREALGRIQGLMS